jgi:hypothetical protein
MPIDLAQSNQLPFESIDDFIYTLKSSRRIKAHSDLAVSVLLFQEK